MLIEFEVGNFLSINKPVRFSMVAATPVKEFLTENTFEVLKFRLLKSCAIYGANASGKSNLLEAMSFMRDFILSSAKESQSTEPINISPFKFDSISENGPSRFQMIFILGDQQHRYGFEVDRKMVTSEWLFQNDGKKEKPLFIRQKNNIEIMQNFEEGKGLEQRTRDNALFLSIVDQMNGPNAKNILKWFSHFRVIEGLKDEMYEKFTIKMLQDQNTRPLILDLIRSADLGIEDFKVDEIDLNVDALKILNEEFKKQVIAQIGSNKSFRLSTLHPKYTENVRSGSAILDFKSEESEGTKKFFRLVGPILNCLKNGWIVVIDELDAKLHPLLTRALISLFHNPKVNTRNAQLVFGTHDTNLLCYGNFRRDQVWFTEKNHQGATDLYSLVEIKLPKGTKVRNDASFEKDYVHGRYGAIPFLGNFGKLLIGSEE